MNNKVCKHACSGKWKMNCLYIVIFLILICSIIFIRKIYSKYSIENKSDASIYQAKNFYFESDLLNDSTDIPSYTYQEGIDKISFVLKNNIDELRYSEVETSYIVELKNFDDTEVTDKDGNIVNSVTGILSNANIESKVISFNNLKEGNYKIIAKAESPYSKTLQANFTLLGNDNTVTYSVSDSKDSPILKVTVMTKDYSGNICISWPEGISPDSTDMNFSNINSGFESSNTTINFKANSEYTFQFFKQNPSQIFSNDDILVKKI